MFTCCLISGNLGSSGYRIELGTDLKSKCSHNSNCVSRLASQVGSISEVGIARDMPAEGNLRRGKNGVFDSKDAGKATQKLGILDRRTNPWMARQEQTVFIASAWRVLF